LSHPLDHFLTLLGQAPDQSMIAQGKRTWSRAEVAEMAASQAAGLVAAGIRQQDRVLLILANAPRMVAAIPAIWSLGATPMFLSVKASDKQRQDVIARYRPTLVLDDQRIEALATAASALGGERPTADSDASVVFTSGSTGVPKGVVQKGGTLVSGVARVARSLGNGAQERILVPIPFAHDYGWGQMLSGLVAGHLLILPEREVLVDLADAINLHRPTVLAGVPSLYSALLFGISGFERAETDCLRILTSTGSPFSPRVFAALSERVPQARILRNYGLTETYRGCCLPPEAADAAPGCVGHPIEDVEIRIVDSSGAALPAGLEGEVVHIGAGVFDRYLDDPEATARARRMVDGRPAVFTGDIGRLDAAGRLVLSGRRDRLVKLMDIRVNLTDVEDAIGALEPVRDVAVIARPHELQGTELIAFCIPHHAASPSDIQRQINSALPVHMRARKVIVLEALPRTSVGKVDYPALMTLADPG